MHRPAHIPGHRRTLFLCGLFFTQAAWTQTPAPMSLDEARAQRARAEVLKAEAQQRYAVEKDGCYRKFLVNDCLVAAKTRHTAETLKIRQLDAAGRDVERETHRQEVEAKEAARAADLPQREAGQQAQAEHYREQEAAKADERERKLADKARQAEEGRRKSAAEQAARNEKQAKRAQDHAERAAKKTAKQTEADNAASR